MGERNSVYVFKGPTKGAFRDAVNAAVTQLGGKLHWAQQSNHDNSNLWTSHSGPVHAAYIHWNDYEIAERVGTDLDVPWINLRIQEGSLWDYSLYRGQVHLHNFSTLPEYWEPDDKDWLATQRGDSHVLAQTWGIDESRIKNYLEPWGHWDEEQDDLVYTASGKAYDDDRHGYLSIWQMNDFLRALGALDPGWNEPYSIPRGIEPPDATR